MNECMNTDKIMCKERHNTHNVPKHMFCKATLGQIMMSYRCSF